MTDEDIEFELEDSENDEQGGEDNNDDADGNESGDGKKKTLSLEDFKKLPPEEQFKLNQKLYARVKNAETALRTAKTTGAPAGKKPSAITKVTKPNEETTEQRIARLELVEEKRQAGHELGLNPAETDRAFQYFGHKPTKEDLKDSFFKAGLDEMRKAERLSRNTPRPQNKSFIQPGKKMSELKPEEKQAVFAERMNAGRNRNR